MAVGVTLLAAMLTLTGFIEPPRGVTWAAMSLVPPLGGAMVGILAGRVTGTQISARGIRTRSVFNGDVAPWDEVVDLRAERRGARTVVSVYLNSGASVQLQAPYSGELFASDPRFEGKMFALSHLWRSHRFGGLPG
ncbi:PH domain-containing protein [Paractinoplanes ovalisporus]|uniref:PH domain-containing protein n=1 Tax=Paractinoplanes ovalisporus TaxID=2810368 RepID=UPI0027DB041A|nr:PH domain-containing protein [Actinoplanes ovalisporus]